MFEGTGYDHIMIPLEGYYDYQTKNNILVFNMKINTF